MGQHDSSPDLDALASELNSSFKNWVWRVDESRDALIGTRRRQLHSQENGWSYSEENGVHSLHENYGDPTRPFGTVHIENVRRLIVRPVAHGFSTTYVSRESSSRTDLSGVTKPSYHAKGSPLECCDSVVTGTQAEFIKQLKLLVAGKENRIATPVAEELCWTDDDKVIDHGRSTVPLHVQLRSRRVSPPSAASNTAEAPAATHRREVEPTAAAPGRGEPVRWSTVGASALAQLAMEEIRESRSRERGVRVGADDKRPAPARSARAEPFTFGPPRLHQSRSGARLVRAILIASALLVAVALLRSCR